ncbi:hypothetical protein CI109_103270 [Kwoniella shandongensis]|uniref:CoA-binding domain-containing protein n=1 Tax=Kwoniella shandongensis TaxID=1734106 RepID=A0A5M6BS45_9TREE|nr:uncharacterized protein CI109_006058 [Kwoniella shandongensis]KAA5525607.1 hypothetical protein CI109_006058 [Kwoniella shandongensis]
MSAVTPAMKNFFSAQKYAVIGRVLSDRSRFDNKVLRWYQTRDFPVTAVRPDQPSEEIEGLQVLTDPLSIPDLSSTSISIIIHPSKSLPILKSLFPSPPSPNNEPHSVWFQPGADDASIWEWVKERGLEGKVVGHGACVLRDGDGVLAEIGAGTKGRL